MASGPNPKSAVMIATVGCVAFWTAFRVLRQRVIDALAKVGVTAVPPIDFYDALVETGKNVIDAANLRQRKCPIKPDSLSRTGVGVERTDEQAEDDDDAGDLCHVRLSF